MSYLVVSLSALFAFVQVAGAELSAKAKAAIDANEAGRRAINTISYKLKSTSSSDRHKDITRTAEVKQSGSSFRVFQTQPIELREMVVDGVRKPIEQKQLAAIGRTLACVSVRNERESILWLNLQNAYLYPHAADGKPDRQAGERLTLFTPRDLILRAYGDGESPLKALIERNDAAWADQIIQDAEKGSRLILPLDEAPRLSENET